MPSAPRAVGAVCRGPRGDEVVDQSWGQGCGSRGGIPWEGSLEESRGDASRQSPLESVGPRKQGSGWSPFFDLTLLTW